MHSSSKDEPFVPCMQMSHLVRFLSVLLGTRVMLLSDLDSIPDASRRATHAKSSLSLESRPFIEDNEQYIISFSEHITNCFFSITIQFNHKIQDRVCIVVRAYCLPPMWPGFDSGRDAISGLSFLILYFPLTGFSFLFFFFFPVTPDFHSHRFHLI